MPAKPFHNLMTLEAALARMSLVDPLVLDTCRQELGPRPSVDELIATLLRRNALTRYQADRLKKGEPESLRLGPYKLLYRNAAGSFARVYRAASIYDGRIVGIKLLRQRWAADARIVNLFRREGELGKRLKHPNIVPIYEVVSEGDKHYFTMEFVEGGNFRDMLKIRRKFSPAEATKYICDMAEGLQYALSQGVTHRDLKLTNVLFSAQGVAKLVDFGLAGNDQGLSTFEEEVDRALEYAALEKGSGAAENDPRSDLYFLGAIYYELLTGQAPYPPTRDRQERKRFGRYKHIRPMRSIEPNMPAVVENVVSMLMRVNPNERYQSAGQLLTDLKAVLADQRISETTLNNSANPGADPYDRLFPADDTATSALSVDTAGEESSKSFPPVELKPATPTILCVENRQKHQDTLRVYFTKHGFRVLLLSDAQRALSRLSTTPPDALVLVGDVIGAHQLPGVYHSAVFKSKKTGTAVVVILGKQTPAGPLEDDPQARVLQQPVTLRHIRQAIEEIRRRNTSAG